MMGAATRNAPFPTLKVVGSTPPQASLRSTATMPVPTATPAQLSQLPAQVNIAAYAGDDLAFTLTAVNSDQSATDLTGATILAQIRSQPGADPPAATFATSVSGNVITLKLDAATTQPLSGVLSWDCQITYSDGKVHTLAAGVLSMTADISRAP